MVVREIIIKIVLAMYRSNKENKGNYSLIGFIRRGLELTSIRKFNNFRIKYLPKLGGEKLRDVDRLL